MIEIGIDKEPHLFDLIIRMKCVMATTCSVESLFSNVKNTLHCNMSTEKLNEILESILTGKRNELETFKSYCDEFDEFIKHMMFKE